MLNDKVIIVGSGKCGTTFLMRLLTVLGLDTGYSTDNMHLHISETSNGGLEWPIRGRKSKHPSPRIIKNPKLCLDLLERMDRWGWNIEHLYISIRDFKLVAKHRFYRNKISKVEDTVISDLKGEKGEKQKEFIGSLSDEEVLHIKAMRAASTVGYLMEQLTKVEIPYTLINFPRSVDDPEYCWSKLKYLVEGMDKQNFLRAHQRTVDLKKVRYR